MRGLHLDAFIRFGIHPAAQDPATGKRYRMRCRTADDRKLDIAIERRSSDGLPFAPSSDLGILLQQVMLLLQFLLHLMLL